MGQANDNGGTPFNEQLWNQSYGGSAPEPEPQQAKQEPPATEVPAEPKPVPKP